MGRLLSYTNIYHLSAEPYIISFLSSFRRAGVSVFGGEIRHIWKWRWRNLAEAPGIIQHNIVDSYPSSMSQKSCSRKKPPRWKIIHTHTLLLVWLIFGLISFLYFLNDHNCTFACQLYMLFMQKPVILFQKL